MTQLDQLHAIHEESSNLFENSTDPDVRDILAQTLTVTRNLIPLLEAGEPITEDLEQEIQGAIAHGRHKIAAALMLLEPVPDTLRSGEHTLPDNQEEK